MEYTFQGFLFIKLICESVYIKKSCREYLKNCEKYIAQGRAIEGNAAQQAAREEADVKFSLKLQKNLFKATDDKQFKECTKFLKEAIEKGEVSKDLFTSKQLAQINAGKPRIQGFTWHHHQVPGKIQLVISQVHDVNHLGGNKLWGDGIR